MEIKYRIVDDFDAKWYWIIFGVNGAAEAESVHGYTRRSDADRALKRFVKRLSPPNTLKPVEW